MDLSLKLNTNHEEIVKMFQSRMAEYDARLDKVASSSSNASDLAGLVQDYANFKHFVWRTLSLMKAQMELLSLGIERHEAFMRRKVLLIHGLSEESNEKPVARAIKVFKDQMGLSDISEDDIYVSHRLGSNKSKARPLLVRFSDPRARHHVWDNKTALKGTGITITEFLTKARHQMFMEARKHFGVRSCWTADSKVVILLPDKTRHKVELKSELCELIKLHPASVAESSVSAKHVQSQRQSVVNVTVRPRKH